MDYFSITKSPLKADLYNSRDFFWADECKKWICFDPDLNKTLLNDNRFFVIKYELSVVEDRFHLNLQALKRVIENLPVTQNGDKHKLLRRNFAIQIKSKYDESLSCFTSNISNLIQTILESGGEKINLQEHLAKTVWHTVCVLSDLDKDTISHLQDLSQIFDETLSLSNRIKLNNSIAELAADIKKSIQNDDEIYFKIALMALGNDSLLGTLQESILLTFLRNDGVYLDEMDWDEAIPATGVPVIERVASEDVETQQHFILKGQRVRLYLDASGYSEIDGPQYSSLYFGSGSHLCLGMPLGTKIWENLRNEFKKIHRKVKVETIKYRDNDNVFNLLSNFEVKFYE